MDSDKQLSLMEYVGRNSPVKWAELNSIVIKERFPFARSTVDLEQGNTGRPADLPFANPKSAEAALRKIELDRLVWRDACDAIASGDWECRGRPEGQLDWRVLPVELLARAVPDFSTDSLLFLGELYEDVKFVRTSPVGGDERALGVIQRFCETHDPGAHIVADVIRAIETEASLQMSDGHVRQLMKRACVNERWFAAGRRSARRTVCKP